MITKVTHFKALAMSINHLHYFQNNHNINNLQHKSARKASWAEEN
jgi:hypothetical protein